MVYGSRGLSGLSKVSPGVDEVLQMILEPTLAVSRTWARGSGIWRMSYVGPEWSDSMTYNDTKHTCP
jgi:hypothetical protein